MRDLLLTLFVFGSVPFVLRWPVYGVLLYVWVSVMSPHRLTWSFAYSMPFAQVLAIATLVGLVFSRAPKRFPVTPTTVLLALLVLWMCVTTLFALDPVSAPVQWNKVMKIQLMVFISLCVLQTKQHVQALMWVLAGSVAFFGMKGGLFTIMGGGGERVYGPAGSFIEENNSLAVAVIMTIPLLRYLQLQATNKWLRWGLFGAMGLCFFSALGSHSRGGLLAIAAMLAFLWLKGRKKVLTGLMIVAMIPIGAAVMSERWEQRMQTIETYDQDASAMGRLNTWRMAYNLATDRPLVGGGFECYGPAQFARYAPNPTDVHAWHSIYFTMLGEHGFVGLGLFLLLWFLVWRDASWIKKNTEKREGWKWAADLAAMSQVALIGYLVGGAFLSLAYYDVPYNLLVLIVLTRMLVEKEVKGEQPKGWFQARPPANAAGAGVATANTGAGPGPARRIDNPTPLRRTGPRGHPGSKPLS